MEDFTNFYEMEIPFDFIYLDFAKDFDRVSHQILLTKLYNNRHQFNKLDQRFSKRKRAKGSSKS